ncbi:hypothetical protein KEM09_20560 [Carboxylicivirga mesophila]|uniref:Uncharacterized protein n=1 Tax=Carboxylicivirga mesophila TaxID=1166478 RepID=A0ABS5KG78_9BACT|nr:hypothetical protein [Carboxylicivirga mesophila]MBS2213812.1 hypothetical protein [Carboxylicivirga mesophila]
MTKSLFVGIGRNKEFFHFCIVIKEYIKYQKVFNRLALILIVLFAIQIASNALFYHTHKIDGKTYSHAHPGCDGHSHNSADFTFYQQLQTMLSEESPDLLSDILPVYFNKLKFETVITANNKFIKHSAGRAPPVA